MTEEELQQDNKTVEQIVDDMDLFDDDLMSVVFDGVAEISVWTFWQRIAQESTTILKCRRSRRAHISVVPDLTAA